MPNRFLVEHLKDSLELLQMKRRGRAALVEVVPVSTLEVEVVLVWNAIDLGILIEELRTHAAESALVRAWQLDGGLGYRVLSDSR